MSNYAIFESSQFQVALPGDNIVDAVESGFRTIAKRLNIGNVAGYNLRGIRAENSNDIGGGAPGIEVSIRASGLPLANGRGGDTERLYVARLVGPALEAPVEWTERDGKLVSNVEHASC